MARTSAVAALRDRLAEVTAERDRLRAAIEVYGNALVDHACDYTEATAHTVTTARSAMFAQVNKIVVGGEGGSTGNGDPANASASDSPTPSGGNIAATQSTASAEDRAATDGAGSRLPHGEGPHDATSTAPGPTAEGTLPAPKDDHRCGPNCWGRCTHDPGAAL